MISLRLKLMPIALLLALTACAVPPGPSPTPTTSTVTSPQTAAGGTLAPQSAVDLQRKAMRAGFEKDVDAFANGTSYDVSLEVTDSPVVVSGHQVVHYVNQTGAATDKIEFRLYLNGMADTPMQQVTNVTVDGQTATTDLSARSSVLAVHLPHSLASGQSADVAMDFSMALPDNYQFSYGRIENSEGFIVLSSFLPLLSVYHDGRWSEDMPVPQGDPAYSETALWTVTLTSPSAYQVAASGVTVSQTQADAGRVKREFVTGPVRDFSVTLSKRMTLTTDERDGVRVNLWTTSGKPDIDATVLNKTFDSLRIFDNQFGTYPFAEFDVIETPITALGIEYPQLIYLADSTWDHLDDYQLEFVLSHETAHQWWYSMVGDDQINEPFVDEALADYSVIVYFRGEYGADSGARIRSYYQTQLDQYLSNHHTQMPAGLPASAYGEDQYGVFVYDAGALFYSHLEDQGSPDRVYAMLRAWYTQHRYGVGTIADMRRLVVSTFGPDGGKLFDQWVTGG